MLHLDKIFSGKIRVRLLTRLLLNPETKVYLRGLEKELGVSSNTVRLELNKLSEMKLIEAEGQSGKATTKTKHFKVNRKHPLFGSLRGIVLKYVGLDQIAEILIEKLGNVEKVYLTGDLAAGKNSPFVDLVIVGGIDKNYLNKLIEKTEKLIEKKIRVAVYSETSFSEKTLLGVEKIELINLGVEKIELINLADKKIAVIGLGYVGLPLAVEFGKKYKTVGFDINEERVKELQSGMDRTREADLDEMKIATTGTQSSGLTFSCNKEDLKKCNIYIVTVPTPINQFKAPDLAPLLKASAMLGQVLKKGDIVIYESTVYPGCTEEDCVPVLEKTSSLKFNQDFYCGYSPERINPGDKINTLTKIKKVTSGSTPEIAEVVDVLYRSIITAGTHKAPSLKVAEASKAIENAQRDVNISFVNELALIFDRMGIDTNDVLDAAGTKWNFLKFKPGLVGGHCIGVDPYYLAHKAESLGYHPQVILSGRRVNDSMGDYVADNVIKLMLRKGIQVVNSKILVLGFTFKENCPDVRNTRVINIVKKLLLYKTDLTVFDPWANPKEVEKEYKIKLVANLAEISTKKFEAIILAVAHNEFKELDLSTLKSSGNTVLFDVKGILPKEKVDGRL